MGAAGEVPEMPPGGAVELLPGGMGVPPKERSTPDEAIEKYDG